MRLIASRKTDCSSTGLLMASFYLENFSGELDDQKNPNRCN